jgi:anti-anti-sigma factor
MSKPPDEPCEGRIDVECSTGVWVLTLYGEHDVATQPTLREQLELVGEAGGAVLVDLSHARFIDSTVISSLARYRQQARDPARFGLVAPARYQGSHLIEVIGIGTVIPVYPTRDRAIAALTER